MRRAGQIAATEFSVASQFSTDRRRTATKLGRDRSHRHARRTGEPELLPLRERQTSALEITAATRAHAAVGDHPPGALLAIGPRCYRGIADELATLQLGPENLHVLGDHVISEPDDQHPNSVRCCDHHENPRNPQRYGSNHPINVGGFSGCGPACQTGGVDGERLPGAHWSVRWCAVRAGGAGEGGVVAVASVDDLAPPAWCVVPGLEAPGCPAGCDPVTAKSWQRQRHAECVVVVDGGEGFGLPGHRTPASTSTTTTSNACRRSGMTTSTCSAATSSAPPLLPTDNSDPCVTPPRWTFDQLRTRA